MSTATLLVHDTSIVGTTSTSEINIPQRRNSSTKLKLDIQTPNCSSSYSCAKSRNSVHRLASSCPHDPIHHVNMNGPANRFQLASVSLLPVLQSAYNSVPDAILVASSIHHSTLPCKDTTSLMQEWEILFANHSACDLLCQSNGAVSETSLQGCSVARVLPGLMALPLNSLSALSAQQSQSLTSVNACSLLGGAPIPVDVTISKLPSDAVFDRTGMTSDIGELVPWVLTLKRADVQVKAKIPSRYETEFEELGCIGKGGYGVVYRARNLLDGQDYAIKKVKLSCPSFDLSTLAATVNAPLSTTSSPGGEETPTRADQVTVGHTPDPHSGSTRRLRSVSQSDSRLITEVKLFARLANHPNVVNYHTAWIEDVSTEAESPSIQSTAVFTPNHLPLKLNDISSPNVGKSSASIHSATSSLPSPSTITSTVAATSKTTHNDLPGPSNTTTSTIQAKTSFFRSPSYSSLLSSSPHHPFFSNIDKTSSSTASSATTRSSSSDATNASVGPSTGYVNGEVSDSDSDTSALIFRRSGPATLLDGWSLPAMSDPSQQQSRSNHHKNNKDNSSKQINNNQQSHHLHHLNFHRTSSESSSVTSSEDMFQRVPLLDTSGMQSQLGSSDAATQKKPSIITAALKQKQKQSPRQQKQQQCGPNTQIQQQQHQLPPQQRQQKHSATLYIQMQLCPYMTLRSFISEENAALSSPVTLKSVVDDEDALVSQARRLTKLHIFMQIVDGLVHIHSQNVIHRDLKPDNIFVEEDYHVLLGDFGLAKSIADHALSPNSGGCATITEFDASTDQGTFFYIAPEILNHQTCTTRSDIYSLGVLLVELFHPFNTAMERVVTLNNLKATNTPPPLLPADISDLVERLIHPDPSCRPSAVDIVLDPIFADLGISHITAPYFSPSASFNSGSLRSRRSLPVLRHHHSFSGHSAGRFGSHMSGSPPMFSPVGKWMCGTENSPSTSPQSIPYLRQRLLDQLHHHHHSHNHNINNNQHHHINHQNQHHINNHYSPMHEYYVNSRSTKSLPRSRILSWDSGVIPAPTIRSSSPQSTLTVMSAPFWDHTHTQPQAGTETGSSNAASSLQSSTHYPLKPLPLLPPSSPHIAHRSRFTSNSSACTSYCRKSTEEFVASGPSFCMEDLVGDSAGGCSAHVGDVDGDDTDSYCLSSETAAMTFAKDGSTSVGTTSPLSTSDNLGASTPAAAVVPDLTVIGSQLGSALSSFWGIFKKGAESSSETTILNHRARVSTDAKVSSESLGETIVVSERSLPSQNPPLLQSYVPSDKTNPISSLVNKENHVAMAPNETPSDRIKALEHDVSFLLAKLEAMHARQMELESAMKSST